ncbi:MAG: ABC transporter substrate-binding protein [Chloroflexi bacterium]|nr:ABC transporter substrate-binding protein [Chloroflexota bacterium]
MSPHRIKPLLERILLVILFVALGACTSAPQEPTSPAAATATQAAPAASPTQAPSEAPAATPTPEAITVTDALGRTLTFQSLPQRIVVAGKASALVMDALYLFPEAKTRIVALSGQGQAAATVAFLRLIDPNMDAKLTLSTDAGPEQIAAQHPDLVVMKSFLADKLGKGVEALGIPVFYLQMETPEEYQKEIRELGKIFGNPARAEEVATYYQNQVDLVKSTAEGLSDEQKPWVLVMQHTTKGGTVAYKVPSPQWLQTTLVRLGGGVPVWAESPLGSGWSVVNMEQIAAWNPDQIFIIDYFADPAQAVADFSADPTAQHLKAVQNGQVYPFPKDFVSWDQPDTRWVLGMLWMAKQMQPQAFAQVDMKAEIETFYRTLYGLDDAGMQAVWERLGNQLNLPTPQP